MPLTDFAEKERSEGWFEVEDWEQELASQPDLANLLEEQCKAQEAARLAEYAVVKRRRVERHAACKGCDGGHLTA